MIKLVSDADLIDAYLGLMPGVSRHQFMVEMGRGIAADILITSTDRGDAGADAAADEDDVDAREVVELFLLGMRPEHDAHGYLDEYWDLIWDAAWPEGLAHALLGTQEHDTYAAANLLTEIERYAAEIGMPTAPWFDEQDLRNFIQSWRIAALERLQLLARRR